ncbi:L-threonylcarbamoyladenylate synthase [Cupriavidus necator]|uniref:Threonylcarbamoyl-AMP synthase n=2 Tax=Cupriavidus necator (strain ATCC 17699 / DSM 428 / KCTC 22496 / NCIMB 10442 / H16 / Stanier 337) TaxID=381666 RepID=A0AAE5ZCV2_CUPNH|nr:MULTISPECIES: L-threonylcarbamoyladenylate synthase [Cupriavidus]EON18613.1 translation factor (SUA5) [Cupriavidus sp. GA3-3]KUE86136.1 translation factor Sua5 [Cupriavidus necator]QCB99658.1 threonylcarbamoyl-AMP synthase [Cupriavidus necator H16]QQB77524.1 threonylcarbamoyl-AMP synthase [Cupriavidus necator]WKA41494.1 L-threonylcarbamoyladenylate synthase [Cupriavidus necator]
MSPRMPTAAELDEAVRLLEAGQLVAFPTETVYGLGADAENPEAVARIFALKGRPSNHPVIVHVVDGADIGYWTDEVPEAAQQLIDAFWPGPLTLILKRAAHIHPAVAGGQDSIGVRCPSHPVAQALLARFKRGRGGIAAPSANKFGQVSPTTAQHVRDEFGDAVYVLEGDGVEVGIESTIVDLSRLDQGIGPVLLRPGAITAAMMAQVLGAAPLPPDAAAPRASGTLKAHYAPHTPLLLADAQAASAQLASLPDDARVAWVGRAPLVDQRCTWVQAPADAAAYARELYRLLRKLDKQGYTQLMFEVLPEGQDWAGVRDRLERAAAAFGG